MRVSLSWLDEWIPLPEPGELAHRLTQGGLEIESDEDGDGADFAGIVVGHVLEREAHPQADRLSLCKVDLGDGEPVDIVCGAPNVAAGLKVAVAPPGSRLPDGTKLKRSKIRGVVSNGMICSSRELGLGDDHSGILELDASLVPGRPFAEVAPVGDRVLDIALTPNRGDCASLLGVAREVRAHFGGEVTLPDCHVSGETGDATEGELTLRIEAPEQCHRYVARLVRGVSVGPSPSWLVERLDAAGIRSINNIVDITNLVMLEFGQPLHAFDASKLRGATILVRMATADEKLLTLDGQTRTLHPDDLVIADAERAIALAGVMGGAETEMQAQSVDVLIEAAHFDPIGVRRTARRHNLHSEASYRFERGIDGQGVERAADRAARLMAELAGGVPAPGRAVEVGQAPGVVETVSLDPARVNRLLGTDLDVETIRTLLGRLEIVCADEGGGRLACRIPSHRNDLAIEADLIEEVARIHGYEQIEPTLPEVRLAPVAPARDRVVAEAARDTLVAQGFVECMTLPMESGAAHDALGLAEEDPRRQGVALRNPLVDEERLLRTQLVASLLRVARLNLDRQRASLRVFEVGRVFSPAEEGLADERRQLAAVMAGEGEGLWRRAESPYFALKGAAERVLESLSLAPRFKAQAGEAFLHPGASAQLLLGKQRVGVLGELHPECARRFSIDAPCALLVLDLDAVAARENVETRYEPVSRQPSVRRDLALVVDGQQAAGALLSAIRQGGGGLLREVQLFDLYEGRGVPAGKKSLAFRLEFQHTERTLKEAEVQKATDRIVQVLAKQFGAELR